MDPYEPDHILQFFAYAHLPPRLQGVSKPFCDLAIRMTDADYAPGDTGDPLTLPRNPERAVALRKLLEAKDAAVRALLAK